MSTESLGFERLPQASDVFTVEGVAVSTLTVAAAAQKICAACPAQKSFSVFTINLDHVVKLRTSPAFKQAYAKARLVLADGFPIVLAGRILGKSLQRAAGSDLIDPMCAEAARRGLTVVFIGSTPAALGTAASILTAQYPGLNIAGSYSPPNPFDPLTSEADEALAFLRRTKPDICFLALGAPKQEVFAARACDEVDGIAFLCIGGGLDFIAGTQSRAPRAFQKTNLEWLWRLLSNPQRLARRYLDCARVVPSLFIAALTARRAAR